MPAEAQTGRRRVESTAHFAYGLVPMGSMQQQAWISEIAGAEG
jgi:hypothetical protein